MELFNYFRSSASYRVRIALALKGLDYDYRSVHLQKNEQLGEVYASVSAARLVPLKQDTAIRAIKVLFIFKDSFHWITTHGMVAMCTALSVTGGACDPAICAPRPVAARWRLQALQAASRPG
jgi:hypothetical protein